MANFEAFLQTINLIAHLNFPKSVTTISSVAILTLSNAIIFIFSIFFYRIAKNLNWNATSKPIVKVFIVSVVKNCDVLVTKKVFHWNQKYQRMDLWWFKIALMLLLPIYTKPIAKVITWCDRAIWILNFLYTM